MPDPDRSPAKGFPASQNPSAMQEFLAHFARDHDQILEHIVVLLHDFHDAEDVFQRTSLILWQKFDQFDPQQGSFSSWACGVAYYEVRNFLRVAARDRLRFSDELLELLADQRQRAARPTPSWEVALEHCLEELSEANRGLLRRMYAAGESAQEIAAAMGREVQTVYNRVSLLRRKLARCVKDQLATEGALS